jgi:hypothetical protein
VHEIVVKVYTLDASESSDISGVALTKNLIRRLNGARQFVVELNSADSPGDFTDDVPILHAGDRKLVVWRDGVVIFHGRIFTIERTGDGSRNTTTVTAMDPLMELGYESGDRAGRPVRDDTGNFVNPTFDSPITGAQLLYEVLVNSGQTGAESDPTPGEGPLPIYVDAANFDSTDDLSPDGSMAWPAYIGDLVQQLVDTNVIDVDLDPLDPAGGTGDAYDMVVFHAVDELGADRSATVHFDYWTGSKNAASCRQVEDFSTINNKLYDYLGPRIDSSHWKGNITPGSSGTTVDPSASRTRYGGQFMQIRTFDQDGVFSVKPLYLALWNAEQGLRVDPRFTLHITPAADEAALFEPFDDYDVGDLVTVNVGADFGVAVAGVQRVYGFDVEWDRNGVEKVSGLLTAEDVT